jgi:predicted secreted acid phosphatase
LALVLDIDETSLSNYDNLVARDFANDKQSIERAMLAADAPPIEPTLKLYQTALKHHIAVFFVTGRNPSLKKATENNLKRAGYITWSGLYFKSDQYHQKSVVPFKANARKVIEQQGYTVIASIGDQHSDLKGGYAEKTFKLANPYYYIP